MKFTKATKNLMSEMDMSSQTAMARNTDLMGGDRGEDMKITLMKKMGADAEVIARWKAAEKKGVSYEAFLIGLIDEIGKSKTNMSSNKIDTSAFEDDDDMAGGFSANRFNKNRI
jgi:hypothetical protein